MMGHLARKLGLALLAAGVLGTVLPGAATAQAMQDAPAAPDRPPPDPPPSVCHLPTYGGNYYCDYGHQRFTFSYPPLTGIEQVFVIGTDFAVWTRWHVSAGGPLSGWVSLGGGIERSFDSNDFFLRSCGYNSVIVVIRGLDDKLWYRSRLTSNGQWTPWSEGHLPC